MIRILLADDHDVVRRGLRSLLEEHEGWSVVAEARDGSEAIQLAIETKPDVAVLDYKMPIINGLEATRQIHTLVPSTEILVFTMDETQMVTRDFLLAGARGYVLKSDASYSLISAVEALSMHKVFFTGTISETLLNAFLQPNALAPDASLQTDALAPDDALSPDLEDAQEAVTLTRILTPREREVVQLVAEGNSSKEIARALTLSVKTVETHRATIMRKLNVTSVADLVRYAIRGGLVKL